MSKRIIEVEERLPLLPTIPLSLQHLFAMFGSTVLVPFLLNVDPATCLFMNGIGTLGTARHSPLEESSGYAPPHRLPPSRLRPVP